MRSSLAAMGTPDDTTIPDEPLRGTGPTWRLPVGAVRKIAKRTEHLDAWDDVTVENRGQGYFLLTSVDAAGNRVEESLMPGDDA